MKKANLIVFAIALTIMLMGFNTKEEIVRYDVAYYNSYNDPEINNRATQGWRVVSSHANGNGFELVWEKKLYK